MTRDEMIEVMRSSRAEISSDIDAISRDIQAIRDTMQEMSVSAQEMSTSALEWRRDCHVSELKTRSAHRVETLVLAGLIICGIIIVTAMLALRPVITSYERALLSAAQQEKTDG